MRMRELAKQIEEKVFGSNNADLFEEEIEERTWSKEKHKSEFEGNMNNWYGKSHMSRLY